LKRYPARLSQANHAGSDSPSGKLSRGHNAPDFDARDFDAMPLHAAGGRSVTADARLSPSNLVRRFTPKFAAGAENALARFAKPDALPWPTARRGLSLGRLGDLEARLAANAFEVRRAQALRYQVFYEEMSAVPDFRARHTRRDVDRFDKFCDHLLVIDHAGGREAIVGTYRLLRHEIAARHCGFYSAGEFDIAPLFARMPALRFLELGRSCVLPAYRNKRALELLWHGVWAYVRLHRLDVMLGCASLAGTDPQRLALPLAFLHHHAQASAEWRVCAQEGRRVAMDLLSVSDIDPRAALRALPPLVKGYLRLGAMVGDGAVIDRQFGTTDVLMVLPVAAISLRYVEHYGADASRFAAKPLMPADERPLAAA
jgi:putative hemolysin